VGVAGESQRPASSEEPYDAGQPTGKVNMDIVALYRRSMDTFTDAVSRIGAEQWSDPTPCEGWDVRTLVNHLVYEDRWAVPLFEGATIAEVGDRFEGDLLGDDPRAAAAEATQGAYDAVAAPGAMARTVHLSFGDTPAEEYAHQLFADHVVHTWDLTAAIGGDRTLNAELVSALAAWFADREEPYRQAGAIGPRVELPDGASAQDRLIAAFGRDPAWSA
jgi:uncharacterized protein (TIGR03086 family)